MKKKNNDANKTASNNNKTKNWVYKKMENRNIYNTIEKKLKIKCVFISI